MTDLFTPLALGSLVLPNRVWMAPLTRCRATADHVPTALMAEYYAQRASAGLVITECTMVQPDTSSFSGEPGIYNPDQITAWRGVTEAVHQAGGRIVLQIWHGGRACHPQLNGGKQPVGASPLAITDGQVHTANGKVDHVVPQPLEDSDIAAIVVAFGAAARSAVLAGFDGVEIHGANGYLIDQFLRDGSNQRQGPYGGSIENRARLLLEILMTVRAECQLVGLRLSPLNSFNSMVDSDPLALATWLADNLNGRGLGYLHLMRADMAGVQQADVLTPFRERFRGVLVANMGYTPAEANAAIAAGLVDAVAFGRSFLANPDLPHRLAIGAPLNEANPDTFYTPGPVGYTDYPALMTP